MFHLSQYLFGFVLSSFLFFPINVCVIFRSIVFQWRVSLLGLRTGQHNRSHSLFCCPFEWRDAAVVLLNYCWGRRGHLSAEWVSSSAEPNPIARRFSATCFAVFRPWLQRESHLLARPLFLFLCLVRFLIHFTLVLFTFILMLMEWDCTFLGFASRMSSITPSASLQHKRQKAACRNSLLGSLLGGAGNRFSVRVYQCSLSLTLI